MNQKSPRAGEKAIPDLLHVRHLSLGRKSPGPHLPTGSNRPASPTPKHQHVPYRVSQGQAEDLTLPKRRATHRCSQPKPTAALDTEINRCITRPPFYLPYLITGEARAMATQANATRDGGDGEPPPVVRLRLDAGLSAGKKMLWDALAWQRRPGVGRGRSTSHVRLRFQPLGLSTEDAPG